MNAAAPAPRAYTSAEVIGIYTRQLAGLGPNHYAQGWRSQSSQQRRFEALLGIGELTNARILDVGCGLGDFFRFLTEQGIPAEYAGVDFTENMVREARARFPRAAFTVEDVTHPGMEPPASTPDYVVASGLFSYMDDAKMRPALTRMFSWCRKGLAFNLASSLAPEQEPGVYYADPVETFRFCRTLTPWVTLRHDYLPHDFTVYLRREPLTM